MSALAFAVFGFLCAGAHALDDQRLIGWKGETHRRVSCVFSANTISSCRVLCSLLFMLPSVDANRDKFSAPPQRGEGSTELCDSQGRGEDAPRRFRDGGAVGEHRTGRHVGARGRLPSHRFGPSEGVVQRGPGRRRSAADHRPALQPLHHIQVRRMHGSGVLQHVIAWTWQCTPSHELR